MPLRFTLNGAPVEVPDGTSPSTTLLNFLRAGGRTGAKEGCAEGDCGACTVAVLDADAAGGPAWRAVCSCILLLPQVDGRELRTVEGLAAPGGALHPAQEAMVEALGSQCGYCTPGFVMTLTHLFAAEPNADEATLREALGSNICRCTGYVKILAAARDAQARLRTQP
jgi:xanthine dehydrogenase iron-sulfur cluster and FAD-binding subunit A